MSLRKKHAYRITVMARDKTSGVAKMQVTPKKLKPGTLRVYKKRFTFTTGSSKVFVRVRDRAGNFSKWKTVELKTK